MEKLGKVKSLSKAILASGNSVLFIGDRGIGKTSIAWDIAGEMGLEVFYLNVSQMFPENISFPKENNGMLEFITYDLNNKVVILDELTNRNPDMHSLLQSLVLDKRIGTRKFENVYFIATGNRPEESSIAIELPRPLIERFVVIEFPIPSKEEWASYTINKGGNKEFVSFILSSTDNFYYQKAEEIGLEQYPSPRNNTRTALILSEIYKNNLNADNANDEELRIVVTGSSGKAVYTGFVNYLQSGKYFTFKMFKEGQIPQNEREVLMLIVDVAEIGKKGNLNERDVSEVFDMLYTKFPRYKHYFLTFLGIALGREWKEQIYKFAMQNPKTLLAKYLTELKKQLSK